MASVPPFDDPSIKGIARIIGDTSSGFTGAEIGRLLHVCRIPDPGEMTKWRRIATALSDEQAKTKSGNCTVAFVKAAMQPVRWTSDQHGFIAMRDNLNTVLAFSGLSLREDGQMCRRAVATTHGEATVARRLRDEMLRRKGHGEIFKYCTAELVSDDCFGAVFEAVKGMGERIRQMTGLDEDGQRLVQQAFDVARPMIAFNTLRSDTERNEQRGLANLMTGVFAAFRNPEAHEPKLLWHVSEEDALDLLSTLSLVHRRLDRAVVIRAG